jgi:hypothetical protein
VDQTSNTKIRNCHLTLYAVCYVVICLWSYAVKNCYSRCVRQLWTAPVFLIQQNGFTSLPDVWKHKEVKRLNLRNPFQVYHKPRVEELHQFTYYPLRWSNIHCEVVSITCFFKFYTCLSRFTLFLSHLYCSSVFIIPEEFYVIIVYAF